MHFFPTVRLKLMMVGVLPQEILANANLVLVYFVDFIDIRK